MQKVFPHISQQIIMEIRPHTEVIVPTPLAIKTESQPPLTDYLSLLTDVEDDGDLRYIVTGSGDANLDFNNQDVSMGLNWIPTGHKIMLSSY